MSDASRSSAIILFTKAPVPGLVKTRLRIQDDNIGRPTSEEIAELYKSLLRDTLQAVKVACAKMNASLLVSFSPASHENEIREIVKEFFADATYILQEGRTVTEKVRNVFRRAFDEGYSCVALIPGDHPDLESGLFLEALSALNCSGSRVVLGPTFDGGAYLLGFNGPSFERINFSLENTYHVCADIFLKCRNESIPCSFLDNREDIDDWDDARRFLKSQKNLSGRTRPLLEHLVPRSNLDPCTRKKISIIIPTLNEEKGLTHLLDCLDRQTEKDFETILVDGASNDETIAIAINRVDKIAFVGTPSRKGQENVGGLGAKGKTLLFLHADCSVSDTLCQSITRTMEDKAENILGGSCRAIFDGVGTKFSFLNAVRSCGNELLEIHGISSGFFVRRTEFLFANGFRTDVMEEALDLQKRIRYMGTFVSVDETVTSSSRRFRSRKTFVPTVAIWITTVFLTVANLHFTTIEERLWKTAR